MVVYSCCFSEKGKLLKQKLTHSLEDIIWLDADSNSCDLWLAEAFYRRLPVVFIGACGIAVRKIAPFVNDKFTDSPVIVIDEAGEYVIPVLSGHLGGANRLAKKIANVIGGKAVITTATDINHLFAVDVFAQKNSLRICNRDGIKKVSSKILNNQKVTVWIDPEIKNEAGDVPSELELLPSDSSPDFCDILISEEKKTECLVHLVPRKLCFGIGCKKGKSFEEINQFVTEVLREWFPKMNLEDQICAVSSINIKQNEVGLQILAQYYHVPFVTYSASDLENLEGDFAESDFVKEVTGVSNVCERACSCYGKEKGGSYKLILPKSAFNGMTLAVAEVTPKIECWNTHDEK